MDNQSYRNTYIITSDIYLEILKSDLFTFLRRFSQPSESLKVWNVS